MIRQALNEHPVPGVSPPESPLARHLYNVADPDARAAFFSRLHCPYCASTLALTFSADTRPASEYGILECGCHQYPVVDGIPILQQHDELDKVQSFIRARSQKRALLQALNVFRVRWAHGSRWHQLQYHLRCRKLAADTKLSFEKAAQLVRRPKVFADYLVHRYANPSFLAAIAPLMLLGDLDQLVSPSGPIERSPLAPVVLDLASGAGHASFLMRLFFPWLSVVSADQDFVSLYLAKRFIAPQATHVCWDVEVPSPFGDGCFDAVFCLDAFHYFRAKKAIVTELKRVSKSGGMWLFPHLHNRLQRNFVAGIPVAPEKYLECFDCADGRLFDERELLRGLATRREADFSNPPCVSRLNEAPTLTFVHGLTTLRRNRRGLVSLLSADPTLLAVNPIYAIRRVGTTVDLKLNWPNDTIRKECSDVTSILPAHHRLDIRDLISLSDPHSLPDWDRVGELVAKFILVPLPGRYRRNMPSEKTHRVGGDGRRPTPRSRPSTELE